MKKAQVKKLHKGDEVRWTDPDNESGSDCSKIITISTISVVGDIVKITGTDGSDLECFAKELN